MVSTIRVISKLHEYYKDAKTYEERHELLELIGILEEIEMEHLKGADDLK